MSHHSNSALDPPMNCPPGADNLLSQMRQKVVRSCPIHELRHLRARRCRDFGAVGRNECQGSTESRPTTAIRFMVPMCGPPEHVQSFVSYGTKGCIAEASHA